MFSVRILKLSSHMTNNIALNNIDDVQTPKEEEENPGFNQNEDFLKEKSGDSDATPGKKESELITPKEEGKSSPVKSVKNELDPNDFEEENVIRVKRKKSEEKQITPATENLISPREPLESARNLLDKPSENEENKDKQELMKDVNTIRTIPEAPELEEIHSPKNDQEPALNLKVLSFAEQAKEQKGEQKEEIDLLQESKESKQIESKPPELKERLLRNTTALPSLADGFETTQSGMSKRQKIIDIGEANAKMLNIQEEPAESQGDAVIKKHFLMHQMREKKAKEKLAGEGNKVEEESEEKKNLLPQEEELDEDGKEEELKDREENDEGSLGSTSTGATVRSYFSIRAAVDEKYVPKSITNMNYMTIFMFILLLGLAIAYYASELTLYSNIQSSIVNIGYSEKRKSSLFDIGLRVKTLVLINTDNNAKTADARVLNCSSSDKIKLQTEAQNNLTLSALALNDAQTQLSLKTSDMGSGELAKINPENIELKYLATTSSMPSSYYYTIWQTMLEIMVSSLRISNMTIDVINTADPAVFLISKNSLNSVLVSLNQSTNELINHIETSRTNNMTTFLAFLIVASAAATISVLVLVPVINTAKKRKEKVLSLFFLLDDNEIRKYQYKCENFKRVNKLVLHIILKKLNRKVIMMMKINKKWTIMPMKQKEKIKKRKRKQYHAQKRVIKYQFFFD